MNQKFINKIIVSDAIEGLKNFPEQCINCCVTSPPYYGLRDYGHDGQIGLEETPEAYVQKLVELFREVHRVLKNNGTLWLNLGDSYAGSWGAMSHDAKGKAKYMGFNSRPPQSRISGNLKPKDLIGIPWMVAFALRADGWYLRQDIIWHKPNPMPESVTDRCTKAHEYIFLLSKSKKYYYDAESIKTTGKNPDDDIRRITTATTNGKSTPDEIKNGIRKSSKNKSYHNPNNPKYNAAPDERWKDQFNGRVWGDEGKANKRSVWTVSTRPYSEAHFATFPEKLIVDCIKAGCPENGIVLDPFMGSGTTAVVARKLSRNFTGFEINSEYKKIANKRLYKELGMFF